MVVITHVAIAQFLLQEGKADVILLKILLLLLVSV